MTELTREDVLKLARLARLDVTDEEVDEYLRELREILQYVAKLDEADVAGLEPTSQVSGLVNVMRDDQVIDYGMSHTDLMRLAPQSQDSHIKVRRMIG